MQKLVIGAGASGLSLALLWEQAGLTVVDSAREPGGHARSITKNGFLWDRGPHMLFSRDRAILDFMVGSLGDNVNQCRRNNVVSVGGSLLQFPIENDLGSLPLDLTVSCLVDFVEARSDLNAKQTPTNLEDWFLAHFGRSLVDLYFRPYNEKVWNLPLQELSMEWSERIPNPPIADVIKGALAGPTDGYKHQLFYNYPRKGGFGALMQAWADGLKPGMLKLNTSVAQISPSPGRITVTFSDGEAKDFESVISTMPLDELCRITNGCPADIIALADSLIVNPMLVVNLGFHGIDANRFTAVYIPDQDFLVNRVSYPGVYSPENAPRDCFLVQAEITCAPKSPILEWTDEVVIQHVLPGLVVRGLAPEQAPIMISIERYQRAYIVYDQGYSERLEPVLQWFREREIWPHGRFGSHNYLNVDGCVKESVTLLGHFGKTISDQDLRDFFPAPH